MQQVFPCWSLVWAALALLAISGCGKSRPDRVILEYQGFAFEQTFESTFDWLVVDKHWGAIHKMPPLTVDFGDGSPVKLQELSEDWIEEYKRAHPGEYVTLVERGGEGVPLYENVNVHLYKARHFHLRFDNGKLYSIRLMRQGKVINEASEKSVALPASEEQIRAAFGEPKEVHKLSPLR